MGTELASIKSDRKGRSADTSLVYHWRALWPAMAVGCGQGVKDPDSKLLKFGTPAGCSMGSDTTPSRGPGWHGPPGRFKLPSASRPSAGTKELCSTTGVLVPVYGVRVRCEGDVVWRDRLPVPSASRARLAGRPGPDGSALP